MSQKIQMCMQELKSVAADRIVLSALDDVSIQDDIKRCGVCVSTWASLAWLMRTTRADARAGGVDVEHPWLGRALQPRGHLLPHGGQVGCRALVHPRQQGERFFENTIPPIPSERQGASNREPDSLTAVSHRRAQVSDELLATVNEEAAPYVVTLQPYDTLLNEMRTAVDAGGSRMLLCASSSLAIHDVVPEAQKTTKSSPVAYWKVRPCVAQRLLRLPALGRSTRDPKESFSEQLFLTGRRR